MKYILNNEKKIGRMQCVSVSLKLKPLIYFTAHAHSMAHSLPGQQLMTRH